MDDIVGHEEEGFCVGSCVVVASTPFLLQDFKSVESVDEGRRALRKYYVISTRYVTRIAFLNTAAADEIIGDVTSKKSNPGDYHNIPEYRHGCDGLRGKTTINIGSR